MNEEPGCAADNLMSEDISARDIYTWIADYACHHRLEDIIDELFGNEDERQFSVNRIPAMNLKIGLIWHTLINDEKDNYADAVLALDSFITDKLQVGTLELCLRLALGLRLKDIVHSLSLPLTEFTKMLQSHFPEGKFQLDQKHLSQVFDERGLHEFESTVKDVCNYFSALARSKSERHKFIANYEESRFGKQLTDRLLEVAQKVFKELESSQPGTRLEQLVWKGSDTLMQNSCGFWNVWLATQLSGITELTPEHVRGLLQSLQQHMGGLDVAKVPCTDNDTEGGSQASTYIPSSDPDELSDTNTEWHSQWNQANLDDYRTPNLQQFMKPFGIKGCMVLLDKI